MYDNKKIMLNPKKRYPQYFKNWYDFLKIDTNKLISSKDKWKKYCKRNNVRSIKDYIKLSNKKKMLPKMPEEFYKDFTNIENELNLISKKRRF